MEQERKQEVNTLPTQVVLRRPAYITGSCLVCCGCPKWKLVHLTSVHSVDDWCSQEGLRKLKTQYDCLKITSSITSCVLLWTNLGKSQRSTHCPDDWTNVIYHCSTEIKQRSSSATYHKAEQAACRTRSLLRCNRHDWESVYWLSEAFQGKHVYGMFIKRKNRNMKQDPIKWNHAITNT